MTSYQHHIVSNHWPLDCLFNSLSGPISNKYQSTLYWPFVRGIHRWPVNSPHKGPVTRKKLPFDDVIIHSCLQWLDLMLCQHDSSPTNGHQGDMSNDWISSWFTPRIYRRTSATLVPGKLLRHPRISEHNSRLDISYYPATSDNQNWQFN